MAEVATFLNPLWGVVTVLAGEREGGTHCGLPVPGSTETSSISCGSVGLVRTSE